MLTSKLAEFDNDKFKIFISILKFILLNLSKIKIGVNVFDLYISEKIKNLLISSEHISQKTIMKKLESLDWISGYAEKMWVLEKLKDYKNSLRYVNKLRDKFTNGGH